MRRIVLLVLAVVLLGLAAPAAQAAPRLACGAVVTESTKLKGDLVCPTGPALRIEPDGAPVVLDLGGHKVKGSGTGVGIAVSANGVSGAVTVRKGTVSGFATGISVAYAPGTRIDHVKLEGPGSTVAGSVGVAVKASPAYVLDHVTVTEFRNGLQVQAGDGGRVSRSTLAHNGTAVSLTPTVASLTVVRSRIRDNEQGFVLSQSAVTVVRSQVTRNGVGLSLFQSRATVRRSTIADNDTGIDGYSFESGIALSDSTVRDNGTGVRLVEYGLRGTANVIEGNTIKGNDGPGLVLDLQRSLGTPTLRIADNRFLDNGDDPVDVGVPGVSDQGLAVRVTEGAGSVVVADNQARRNAGIGIDTVGVTDGGGNTARSNGGTSQCVGVVCTR